MEVTLICLTLTHNTKNVLHYKMPNNLVDNDCEISDNIIAKPSAIRQYLEIT